MEHGWGEQLQEAAEAFLSTRMLYSNTADMKKVIITEDLNPAVCLCALALLKHSRVLIFFFLIQIMKSNKIFFFLVNNSIFFPQSLDKVKARKKKGTHLHD